MTPAKQVPVGLALLLLLTASCAPPLFGPSTAPQISTPTTASVGQPSQTPGLPTATATLGPLALDLTPLPTATALATLALPSAPAPSVGIRAWDGPPTYLADSRPDFYFRLLYDPLQWASVTDPLGRRVLASRNVTGCTLGLAQGRGLPQSGSAEHEVRMLGGLTFQVSRASLNGVTQFINYAGGNGAIFTAFQVSFGIDVDQCIADAEAVLATLRSVPEDEATPVTPG